MSSRICRACPSFRTMSGQADVTDTSTGMVALRIVTGEMARDDYVS